MHDTLLELLNEVKLRGADGSEAAADGAPVWMDAIRDKVHECEALDIHNGKRIPLMGYRYQLKEHGKWGFISRNLTQVTAAVYDGIAASEHLVAAWVYGENEDRMDLTLSLPTTDDDGQTDIRLQAEEDTRPWPVFRDVNQWLRPQRTAELVVQELEGGVAYLYRSGEDSPIGLLQIYKGGQCRSWHAYYKDGILSVAEFGEVLSKELPADGCTMALCLQALAEESDLAATVCMKVPQLLPVGCCATAMVGTYIIRKNGYWALADLKVGGAPEILRLHTPLCYTKAEHPHGWPEELLLVERFGKKGIYNWHTETFIATCEYESIRRSANFFRLVRHGKERNMWSDGQWWSEEKRLCPKCGTALVKGALYCHMCGTAAEE